MNRTETREWVVKILYEMSINDLSFNNTEKALEYHGIDGTDKENILEVVEGVRANIEKIDKYIEDNANVPLNRILLIDLAILRTSIYEFKISKTVPTSVSINEAVEISKKFSNGQSYKFINGLLSSVEKQ